LQAPVKTTEKNKTKQNKKREKEKFLLPRDMHKFPISKKKKKKSKGKERRPNRIETKTAPQVFTPDVTCQHRLWASKVLNMVWVKMGKSGICLIISIAVL
jgi:hypothetical protein